MIGKYISCTFKPGEGAAYTYFDPNNLATAVGQRLEVEGKDPLSTRRVYVAALDVQKPDTGGRYEIKKVIRAIEEEAANG